MTLQTDKFISKNLSTAYYLDYDPTLLSAYSQKIHDYTAQSLAAQAADILEHDAIIPDICVPIYAATKKKYKPVAKKVNAVPATLPAKFRIERHILGDPLADMPTLSPNPPDYVPTGRYTPERRDFIDSQHATDFLWPEERKLMHHFMMLQNLAFAWDDSERGHFRDDFFPPIEIPTLPHTPWCEKNFAIPPGLLPKICEIIRTKEAAGVYEASNSSYRSKFFTVVKKDGTSLRIVHSLEPLNRVTIKHAGVPPFTDQIAERFAARACGAIMDLYVGYDERKLHPDSRDLTTFQTPYGAKRLTTLPMGWSNSVSTLR